MDPSPLRALEELHGLRDPLLIATFVRRNGFNSTAAAALAQFGVTHNAKPVAEIEADPFYDFSVMPPSVRRVDDRRVLDWPTNEVRLVSEGSLRDVLLIAGVEPHLRWQAFAAALNGYCAGQGVKDLLVLRSWPAAVPHTRPIVQRLTAAGGATFAAELGLKSIDTQYEGPVDFGGLLSTLHAGAGGENAGLTVVVPNYLGVVPNPFALLSLVASLDRLAGTETPLPPVEAAADQLRARATEEMAKNDELREAVSTLEQNYEAIVAQLTGEAATDELPSSADLLADVERFLRGGDDPPPT